LLQRFWITEECGTKISHLSQPYQIKLKQPQVINKLTPFFTVFSQIFAVNSSKADLEIEIKDTRSFQRDISFARKLVSY
jgi:hypothetical protein